MQKKQLYVVSAPLGALVLACVLMALISFPLQAQVSTPNVDLQTNMPSATKLNAGGMLQYDVIVLNFGDHTVPTGTVSISSTMPSSVSFETAFPDCMFTFNTRVCRIENMLAGQARTVPITLTVATTATPGLATVSHCLSIPDNIEDPICRARALTILPQTDLSVTVSGPVTRFVQASADTRIKFGITNLDATQATWVRAIVTQTGSVASGVQWPPYCQARPDNPAIRTCYFQEIAGSAAGSFEISVFFTEPGTYCYTMEMQKSIDYNPGNNDSTHCVSVLPLTQGDLRLAVHTPPTGTIHSPITLTAIVTNVGEIAVSPQFFIDIRPAVSVTAFTGGDCFVFVSPPDPVIPTRFTAVGCYLTSLAPETSAASVDISRVQQDFPALAGMQFVTRFTDTATRSALRPQADAYVTMEVIPQQAGQHCYTAHADFIQEGVKGDPTPLDNTAEGCLTIEGGEDLGSNLFLPLVRR